MSIAITSGEFRFPVKKGGVLALFCSEEQAIAGLPAGRIGGLARRRPAG